LHRKRCLELWIPVDCLPHREQALVCSDIPNVPTRQSNESDFQRIVCRPSSFAIQRMRSYANRNCMVNIAIFKEPGKCGVHTNIAIRRTLTGQCVTPPVTSFDGLYLTENIVTVLARVSLTVRGR